jgi:hypothetical protein
LISVNLTGWLQSAILVLATRTRKDSALNDIDVAKIATTAANYIRDHGLAKTVLINDEGAACFNGALLIALGGDPTYRADYDTNPYATSGLFAVLGSTDEYRTPERRVFDLICRRAAAIIFMQPATFNNQPETTPDQIIALLEEVAEQFHAEASD